MASTNKTPNYALPQFIAQDKPTWLGDVNGAMAAIDTGMAANKTTAEAASTSAAQAVAQVAGAVEDATDAKASASAALTSATNALAQAQQATNAATSATNTANQANTTANTAAGNAVQAVATSTAASTLANQTAADLTNFEHCFTSNAQYQHGEEVFASLITVSPALVVFDYRVENKSVSEIQLFTFANNPYQIINKDLFHSYEINGVTYNVFIEYTEPNTIITLQASSNIMSHRAVFVTSCSTLAYNVWPKQTARNANIKYSVIGHLEM